LLFSYGPDLGSGLTGFYISWLFFGYYKGERSTIGNARAKGASASLLAWRKQRMTEQARLGLAEEDSAAPNGKGNFGEGSDVVGGIGGKDDEIGVEALGDAAGVG
jgi:hypothetical protein